jgi:hypothetical protein
MAHNHQSKRSPDCPNRTKIVQLNPYRFSFSLTSAALNKEGKSLGIWEPKQTGKTLQLYITKGMTENPINKLTPSRFITTKLVRSFIAADDDENIFFTSQAKQSEQTADAIHPPKQLH